MKPLGLVIKLRDQFAVFATFGRPKVGAAGKPSLALGGKMTVKGELSTVMRTAGGVGPYGV